MNNKITLPELSQAVALATGYNAKACESFLRELFAVVAETIVAGENVKIKGLGTFKSVMVEERKSVNVNTGEQMIIPSHRKVTFSPDKALAEAVNAPFAIFEPVELNDSVTEAMLADELEEQLTASAQESKPTTEEESKDVPEEEPTKQKQIPASEPVEEELPIITSVSENTYDKKEEVIQTGEVVVPDVPITSEMSEDEVISNVPEVITHVQHKTHFLKGVLVGALCVVALLALMLLSLRFIMPDTFSAVKNVFATQNAEKPAKNEATTVKVVEVTDAKPEVVDTTASIKPAPVKEEVNVPTLPSDTVNQVSKEVKPQEPKVYNDKITKHRYLTTMAREYYGDYNLWPLIYDYNKGLGHPDRIRPGTKIKVPSVETLGINPKDPTVVRKAKNRGVEIYNKYR